MFPVRNVERRAHVTNISDTCRRQAQQEAGEAAEIICVVNCAARIVSIERETINCLIANYIAAGSDRVVADGPAYGVAEGREFLVHWSISIATAIGNSGESAKHERDLAGSINERWTDDSSISSDFSICKSDT